MTLISAPAGFGKTTLVSEWVENLQSDSKKGEEVKNRIAWLSLDEGDNDTVRFLTYFIAALDHAKGIDTTFGRGELSILQSSQPPPAVAILTSLLNELAESSDKIIFVLDDYHLIEVQPIHNSLTFLLEHLPSQLHLVIVTREDPQFPLARLRSKDQLTELRAADLRFTSFEVAQFLNQVMGLDLSVEAIVALESRTEGWIAGLQLAAISVQGQDDAHSLIKAFTGSHQYVLDYLVEEVLEQQSKGVQTFLMQTAVLDRLTGSLCDAVTGKEDGSDTLELLDKSNLFIVPLDKERRWYRYHHLFSDLLRRRLRQTQPDQLSILHHRASEWYEQNRFTDEAIKHALQAEDFERAANLIEEQIDDVWEQGEHAKLQRWLDGLPAELVLTNPKLCIFLAWDHLVSGDQEAAEESLQAVEQALESNTESTTESLPKELDRLPDSDSMKLQGIAAVIRAFLAFFRADIPEIIQYAHQALEYLPEQELTWRSTAAIALGDAYRVQGDLIAAHSAQLKALEACKLAGDIYPIMLSNVKVAINLRMLGKLQQTIESCQQQMQFSIESGLSQTGMAGWLLAVWGETLAELNDLDGAVHHAKKGIELVKGSGTLAMLTWSYMCLVRILFSIGDLDGAEVIIQKTQDLARTSHVPPWITNQMAAWRARIWLAQDNMEAASKWAGERELASAGTLTHLNEIEYMMLARILIAQERLDEASELLHRLLRPAEMGGRTSIVLEILILQALVLQAQGDTDQAISTLEKAFTLSEPEGFIRIFVDEGPPLAHLLYEAATRGIVPNYTNRLLAAFPITEPEKNASPKAQVPKSELVEPLSEREIEVLQLIANGLTNQEVASRLYLALSTVKVHTRNIYGKLGVNNRTQAVARARTLGILPSL
jgi:LuxR family maltose regulon positive regulatory protein